VSAPCGFYVSLNTREQRRNSAAIDLGREMRQIESDLVEFIGNRVGRGAR
jgi:hypothetical protein